MTVTLTHEKNDVANRLHRRQYTFKPLGPGSPYCPVALGFLHIARRGAFTLPPVEAWEKKTLVIQEGMKDLPLFCMIDTSTQTLTEKPMTVSAMENQIKNNIAAAGFDTMQLSHRSYRSGFATKFVLTKAIENGGRFDQDSIDQLKRLGGWAEKSSVVQLYIKRIIEKYSDTTALLVPGLRNPESREDRLRNIPSAYNFRLIPPARNISTEQEARELFDEEYNTYLSQHKQVQDASGKDAKTVKNAHTTATRDFIKKKNQEQHETRRAQPLGPPKPPPTGTIDVLTTLRKWKEEEESRPPHLDPRSRWVAPAVGTFPELMPCPYRGCEEHLPTASAMDAHVRAARHPKTKQGDSKNWVCSADDKSFPSLDGLRSHINKCHLPKRFKCDLCGYTTNVGGHIQRHRKSAHGAPGKNQKKWRHEQ